MKLSWKFFCVSYIIVLLSTGLGGFLLVNSATNKAWDEREQILEVTETYAVDSFLSLSNLITGEIYQLRCDAMAKQIQNALDTTETSIKIQKLDKKDGDGIILNSGIKNFFSTESLCYMTIDCAVEINNDYYLVQAESNFTDILLYEKEVWSLYRIAVLIISLVSGGLLFAITSRITKPLQRLTTAANAITYGNYGETVKINDSSVEIASLSESFNNMSTAVKKSMDAVKTEIKKRETFIADFTHEMKTPMTSIIGYADLLRSYELDDQERKAAANAVFKEGKRLENLSLQLLELIVTKNESCELSRVNLADVESSLSDTLKFHCEKYDVRMKIEFPQESVTANRTLLLSLIYNLADNAFKASPKGGIVEILGEALKDGIKITVADRGKGIREESLQWLLEPFWREDKARSREQNGAGLGLALCNEIAKLHSTKLSFASAPGVGTSVSFILASGGDKN